MADMGSTGKLEAEQIESGSFTQAAPGTESRKRVLGALAELDLMGNVADLDTLGYTIIEDAAPIELFDEIRAAIIDVTEELRARGIEPFNFGPNTSMVYRLLAARDVFGDAVLSPKLSALVSHLLGEGYVTQVVTGSVLDQGSHAGPIHADNQFFPEPFPVQVHLATAIWCCDDFSGDEGSTHVVPGSHRRYRHPKPGEGLDETFPVVAPRGSIVLWSGHTWHRSGERTAPGRRVALHTGFSRPHIRTFEAYTPDEVERLVARDERFTRLVGADLPYGCREDSPDANKLLALAMTTQAQA
jgi:ectoine hydroxylase-related dioxygenase (phytanoyl-CoA dioxygenase family)